MPGSTFSTFSEPDDFQGALRENAGVDLVVTGHGPFWARLSSISLYRMRLLACEERVSRVAFMSISPRLVRVTLPAEPAASLTWAGCGTRPDEIVTHSAGSRFYEQINGPSHWRTLWLPSTDLARAGRALHGAPPIIPPGMSRWRPNPESLASLVGLHGNAIRAIASRASLSVDSEAVRGLEQQLIATLLECLAGSAIEQDNAPRLAHADIMVRLEDLLRSAPPGPLSTAGIAVQLGVSNTTLRMCCHDHLGVAPGAYLFLRRMQQARQALREADPCEQTVARIARHYGFGGLGHFAAAYRVMFGELPSATLRRSTLP